MKKEAVEDINKSWQICFIAMLSVTCVMVPTLAFAVANVGGIICANIAAQFNGPISQSIATIAVCTIGLAACFGRATWQQALVVAVGLGVLFGVSTVLGWFGGTQCGTY